MPSFNQLPVGLAVQTVPVYKYVEYAFRDCGLAAEAQTGQLTNVALQTLEYILQDLVNKHDVRWLLKYYLIGANAGQRQYTLPVGTVDISIANYRTPTVPAISSALPTDNPTAINAFDKNLDTYFSVYSSPNYDNWVGAYYDNAIQPIFLGINAYNPGYPNYPYTIQLDYSSDGVNWVNAFTFPVVELNDRSWYYWQLDGLPSANYWRVSDFLYALELREVVIGTVETDIPLARLNKDDYFNLPNKDFQSGRALQYWFDRQITPVINLWPVPGDDFQVYQFLLEMQLSSITNLGDVIVIPNRWINAIQTALSARLALQLPNIPIDRINLLQGLAERAWKDAQFEERDKSPIYIRPNNRYYTR